MSEAFAKFLQSSYGQFNPQIQSQFSAGLAKSTGSMAGLERMTSTLF
jgi:hypothetical protein